MKIIITILYGILFSTLALVASSSILNVNQKVIAACAAVALVVALFILYSLMRYVRRLLFKSNAVLNKNSAPVYTWSFNNFHTLAENQNDIATKIHQSAKMITNLASTENGTTDIEEFATDDAIGEALQSIKKEMVRLKVDDDRRAWTSQGLANFSNVLRNKLEVKEYGYQIISHLVKYMRASQGALFIEYREDDGERYLEMNAGYAYDKRTHETKKIYEGQGMLGQCMVEQEFVFLNDIPSDYVKITSGLGEAVPRNIMVLPLLFNEKFCGVIEMASFERLQPHEIEFLQKVSESIAAEIASLKNMGQTQSLLDESKTLTLELQSREEEMKQNLEELAATQDEMARKQIELSGIINAIDSTLATAEFDSQGKLIKHNTILEEFTGHNTGQLKDSSYSMLTGNLVNVTWQQLFNGDVRSGDFKTTTAEGNALWLSITFTPVLDVHGRPEKLLCMIQNITQKKIKEIEFERLSIVANNTDNSVIITNREGLTEYVNAGFTKMTGYEAGEVLGKKPGALLQGLLTDKTVVEKLSSHIQMGIPVYEEILNYNKAGKTYWVSLAINPVMDDDGKVNQFISIQADITQTKIKSLDFHQKLEALSRSNAILEIDRNGSIIDINANYLSILGYTRAEVIGEPYSMLSRKVHVFTKLMETIDDDGMQSGVFTRYDKSGKRHFMSLMDYPVLNLHGELEKIIEFAVDVSNEKRLEKEADRKQAELDSYLNGINNTIASASFTPDGTFEDGNEIFIKVMGYGREELISKPYNFFASEDQGATMMWDNLKMGRFFSGEFKMRSKTGKELWLTGTFNPIIVEGELPEKIMMFAQFTTQEKEKLNDLGAMVQALKSTLPVLEFNKDFACKTANDKAMKLFGISRLDIRSKSMLDFIDPQYADHWQKQIEGLFDSHFVRFEIPFLIGQKVTNYEVSASITHNLEGEVAKVVVLLVQEVLDKVDVLT